MVARRPLPLYGSRFTFSCTTEAGFYSNWMTMCSAFTREDRNRDATLGTEHQRPPFSPSK
jgi:hypothetical protein